MIELQPHANGVILAVRVQPGARRTELKGEYGGALKLAARGAPEGGRANEAILAALAELFDVRRAEIELLSGAASRTKRVLLHGLTATEAQSRLARRLSGREPESKQASD